MENKIPAGNYHGYLWYSNAHEPTNYNGNGSSINLDDFPFIAEGMLWDESTKTSVMINYTHQLCVAVYKDVDDIQSKTFMGHKTGKRNLKLTTIWKEEEDELCDGMKVLKPIASVFVGYESHGTEI